MVSEIISSADNFRKSKNKYWKFILIFWFIIFITFIIWSFKVDSVAENNLGFWLISSGLPTAIRDFVMYCGLALLLKWVFNKIFNPQKRFPVLITVASVLVIVTASFFAYGPLRFDIKFFFIRNFDWLVIFYLGLLAITIPVILITLTSYLLKIPQPNFWKFNLAPAVITYTLFVLVLPFVLAGFNYSMIKNLRCNWVVGTIPQNNCYYQKAIKTQDVELCQKRKLDKLMKGDCVMAVAVYNKNASLCREALYDQKAIDFCFYEVFLATGEKNLCLEIKDEDLTNQCLNFQASVRQEKIRLSLFQKIKNFILADY